MTQRAFDRETGQVVFVSDEELADGLRSGRLAVSRDAAPVTITGEDGSRLQVEPAELGALLEDQRFRVSTEADRASFREEALEREFGDAPLAAGALGAARGVTLGGSDLVADVLGLSDAARQFQERNVGASIGGEILGSLVGIPALAERAATRGAGLLLRGLSRPAGLALRAGTVGERGAASLLGRASVETLSGRVLSAAERAAVGGTAEGGVLGLGQIVSESALGDEELTAEQVVATVGMNALLGGAGAGIFGGAGALVTEGVSGIGRAAVAGRDVISRAWLNRTGRELSPGVAAMYARATSLASGADEAAVRRFVDLGADGRRAREIVARGDNVFQDGIPRISQSLDAIEPTTRHVADFWGTNLKTTQVRRLIAPGRVDVQATAALDAFEAAQRVADDIADNPGLFSGPGGAIQGRNLRRVTMARREALEAAIARSADEPAEAATEIYQQIDGLKRDIGRFQGRARRDQPTQRLLRGLYDDNFRPLLERSDLWGDGLAAMQTDVNQSFTRWLTRRGDFERMFLARGDRDTVDDFRRLSEAEPGRIEGFLRRAGRAGNERNERTFREVLEAQQELVETMGRHMELPPNIASAIGESRTATQRALTTLDEVTEQASILNQFQELTQAGGVERSLVGAIAGQAVGGPVGALAAGALTSPSSTVRVLGALDRLRGASDDRVSSSVQGFFRRSTRAARRVTERARRAGRRVRRVGRRTAAAAAAITVTRFDSKVEQYGELADAETMTRRLGERTEELSSDAPRTQAAIQRTAVRGAQFVRARMPARSQAAHLVPGRLGRTRPSHAEIASFLRTVRAVEDPMTVLTEFEQGRLSRESIEAVRAVYPQIYARMVTEIQTTLAERAESGDPVPYRDRVQIGILLGVPTDPSLKPETIARLQAVFAATASPGPPPRRPEAVPDFAQNRLTDVQRLEQRI